MFNVWLIETNKTKYLLSSFLIKEQLHLYYCLVCYIVECKHEMKIIVSSVENSEAFRVYLQSEYLDNHSK